MRSITTAALTSRLAASLAATLVAAAIGAACGRSSSPQPGPDGAPETGSPTAVDDTCKGDDDCVFPRGCCPGCGDRVAPYGVVTRSRAEAMRAECPPNRQCGTLDCMSPPPCSSDVEAACVAGRCTVRNLSVELGSAGVGACNCDACGPMPDLGADPKDPCLSYRQLMYEHCCCMHSGIGSCEPRAWVGWDRACAQREQCLPTAASLAAAPDLDGCRATATRGPDAPPPGDFAKRWVEGARGPLIGARMVVWSVEHNLQMVDAATGTRGGLSITGGGSPSTPRPWATADGRTLILSGWRVISVTRPSELGSVTMVRNLDAVGNSSPEVRGATADLTTLLLLDMAAGPMWSIVSYDGARALVPAWDHRVDVRPAGLDGSLAADGKSALVQLACSPQPCTPPWVRLDAATGEQRSLPLPDVASARWLGDRVLLEQRTPNAAPVLWTILRGDFSIERKLWRGGAGSPAVLPDGTPAADLRVAYLTSEHELAIAAADGSARVTVAKEVAGLFPEALSPDGRWVAFQATPKLLRVCRSDGSDCRDIGDVWLRGWLL